MAEASGQGAAGRTQLIAEERLSALVTLRTYDLVAPDGAVLGMRYAVDAGAARAVAFQLDLSGSDNLELEGGGLLRRSEVPAGVKGFEVARVAVVDLSQPWSLQCRYTWTEKEVASKEIAEGLVLETTDMWTKGRAVTAVDYTMRVDLDKRIVVKLDFSGSDNLELATGGLSRMTVVEPRSSAQVGYLQVVDPARPWALKCKYSWEEDTPARLVLGRPERRELAPGVVLITTRTAAGNGDRFKYQVACSKNTIVDFVLDCSESTNVSLESTSEMTQRTTVQPWDRADVGTMVVVEPTQPWSLRCKFDWTERSPRPPKFMAEAAAHSPSTPGPATKSAVHQVDSSELHGTGAAPPTVREERRESSSVMGAAVPSGSPKHDTDVDIRSGLPSPLVRPADVPVLKPPPLSLDVAQAAAEDLGEVVKLLPAPAKRISPRTDPVAIGQASGSAIHLALKAPPPVPGDALDESSTDTKEVRSNVFLTNVHRPGKSAADPLRIVYTLDVRKPTRVTFSCNFEGSHNLVLHDHSAEDALRRTTVVEPFSKVKVAELTVANAAPGTAWNLRLAYHVEEEDLAMEAFVNPPGGSPKHTNSSSTASSSDSSVVTLDQGATDDLAEFLQNLTLAEYLPRFRAEQIDWALLQDMAANETSLRSTLSELGVTTLGHREKIVASLRKQHQK